MVTFLRPGESLAPGHRYIVAMRGLVNASGAPVLAEPAFAAIRDERPSTIPAVNKRAEQLAPVFSRLARFGIDRSELILAFDFVVQSDYSLTHEMLSMRGQAFAWLAGSRGGRADFPGGQVIPHSRLRTSGGAVWRGCATLPGAIFLSGDPFTRPRPASCSATRGRPLWARSPGAVRALPIPCTVFGPGGECSRGPAPGRPVQNGVDLVRASPKRRPSASTSWRRHRFSGLEARCLPRFEDSFIVRVIADVDQFAALPDRLRQGQLDTLVLARMLKQGHFNSDPAAQIGGHGAIDPAAPTYYFGASLGGIMGTMFAALTPDVERLNVDVPASTSRCSSAPRPSSSSSYSCSS
jgi:hypothetical protein